VKGARAASRAPASRAPVRIAAALLLSACLPAGAVPRDAFRLVERSDFSRYVDGKYVGHAYREARGSLAPAGEGYAGEFLVLEETLRDLRSAARRVDRTAPVRLSAGGSPLEPRGDSGYPSLRGLPSFPATARAPLAGSLAPGSAWTAEGTRALDFDDSGAFVLLPFLAQYTYKGGIDYRGRRAESLSAKFATRWKADGRKAPAAGSAASGGSPEARPVSDIVSSASGTHDLDIVVDAETLAPLFIRDRFDESFVLVAGGSERRSGFSLFFFEGASPVDRGATGAAIAAAIGGAGGLGGLSGADSASAGAGAGGAGAGVGGAGAGVGGTGPASAGPDSQPSSQGAGPGPLIAGEGPGLDEDLGPGTTGPMRAAGLELDASPEGLVLRVKDLRFVADSDEILPTEKGRLDAIASALKALPGKSFLVAGHSAAVGKAAGELELSVKRAKRVSDELAARGIEPSRLLYRGYGSSRPLAPNDGEEGRARNRRVEITILD
jgi:outer membrane protein OmpA-like peptidoglycan-associated protein